MFKISHLFSQTLEETNSVTCMLKAFSNIYVFMLIFIYAYTNEHSNFALSTLEFTIRSVDFEQVRNYIRNIFKI
jgi:hypothetical protein